MSYKYKVDEKDIFDDIDKIENDEEDTVEKVDKILKEKKPKDQAKEEYIQMIKEKNEEYDPTQIMKAESTHIFIEEEEKKDVLAELFDKTKHLNL